MIETYDYIQYPTLYTKPLSEPLHSPWGDWLIEFVERYWIDAETNQPLRLDAYQKWLLRSILEQYPDDHPNPLLAGRLRYRQVVVSMGRQNGKSILAAILTAFGLMKKNSKRPLVIGVASTREQAKIVYDRTYYVIKNNVSLSKRIKATTTRGLGWRDGSGTYEYRTGRSAALQGIPITLGIADELHILEEGTWDAMLIGQRAQKNGLLIGITTAGDDSSLLLKRLYKQGERAVEGDNERFGFFLWEAPEGSTIEDHDAIYQANPSIACGRIPIETVLSDIKDQPIPDQQRYTFNRFVAAINPWLPTHLWTSCPAGRVSQKDDPLILAVDVTPNSKFASFVVATKDHEENKVTVNPVKSMENPTPKDILYWVQAFIRRNPDAEVVMDNFSLKKVAEALEEDGVTVNRLTAQDVVTACEQAYVMLAQGRVKHNHHPDVDYQVARGKRKHTGDHWRISREDSTSEIDMLMATVFALYIADHSQPPYIPIM